MMTRLIIVAWMIMCNSVPFHFNAKKCGGSAIYHSHFPQTQLHFIAFMLARAIALLMLN